MAGHPPENGTPRANPGAEPVNVTVLASTLAIGGAEQLLLDLIRALDRERFPVDVIFLRRPGPIGEEIARLGVPWRDGVLRARLDPAAPFRLAAMLRKRGTRVLLMVNHLNALFYGAAAARLAGARAVNWHNETHRRYRAHSLVMALRRVAHLGVDTVVAAARGHKDYIVAAEGVPPGKVEVIQNGVDLGSAARAMPTSQARRMLSLPEGAPVASIVAGLRPDKDHATFLRAAREVLGRVPEARFLVAGDGPLRPALEAMARDLGIAENVSFLGFRRDIPDILAATDVIALSSLPWQETLSVAMLEAMAAGRPAVVTDVGFLSEVVDEGESGFLVPPGDHAALADRLSLLLADPDLRLRMGARAAQAVRERCSVQSMARSFENLFERLAARPARR